LCGKVIEEGQEVTMFQAFVTNELDPLRVFDDGVFHRNCFVQQPRAPEAMRRYDEFSRRHGRGTNVCAVCGRELLDPTDYVEVGHLTSDPADPLQRFNYLRFHISHLREWRDRETFRRELRARIDSGKLRSSIYERMLRASEQ
jgi:hypothetical protein